MKLFVYDHCPYCVRARMPFGLKGIPVELAFLPNDDEATPIGMIGQKMLPVLQDESGFMGESLDIVHKVDGLSEPRLFAGEAREAITAWIARWTPVINDLVIPRTPDAVYPEFASEASRAYYTRKKERTFGSFPDLLAQTDALKARLADGLTQLAEILPDPQGACMDDILLFPLLRSLSCVPGLELPPAVLHYRDTMGKRCGIPMVDDLRNND